jgi:hypothetical protein
MPATSNATLFEALANDADALAAEVAKGHFPVLLQSLAMRCRVTAVEFRPLLVDAMLTTHARGFRILFNSNGDNPTALRNQFEHESPDRLLAPRLRFSLAHELAHTLFYDISGCTPVVAKKFRSGGGRTCLDNLERSCNKLAANLLLPTSLLELAVRGIKTFTPEAIVDLAKRAGVSLEVLIRRLGETNSFLKCDLRGCVVLVKQSGEETAVTAVARPKGVNIATALRLLRAGERWSMCLGDGTAVRPASMPAKSRIQLTVTTQYAESQQDYDVAVLQTGRFGSANSFLILFEEPFKFFI